MPKSPLHIEHSEEKRYTVQTMFLSDKDIENAVRTGEITIDPFDKKRLQPASYDITLGAIFVVQKAYSVEMIDPAKILYPESETFEIGAGETFVLQPGANVTAQTKEYCGSEKHLIKVNGKSGLSRAGLLIHNSSGIVNPGHFLNIVLEITNINHVPIVLRPGMEIAQLTFSPLSSESKSRYSERKKHAFVGFGGYTPPKSGPLARVKNKSKQN